MCHFRKQERKGANVLASRGKRFYLCLSDNKTIVWALEVEVRVEVGVRRRALKFTYLNLPEGTLSRQAVVKSHLPDFRSLLMSAL